MIEDLGPRSRLLFDALELKPTDCPHELAYLRPSRELLCGTPGAPLDEVARSVDQELLAARPGVPSLMAAAQSRHGDVEERDYVSGESFITVYFLRHPDTVAISHLVPFPICKGAADIANPAGVARPGLTQPKLLTRTKTRPAYPELARRKHAVGNVVLLGTVTTDGTLENVCVLETDAKLFGFEYAAWQAVGNWRYRPGAIDGVPAAVRTSIAVHFRFE